jgi:pimeloyl-ACP methyl ester carboxylesterase
MEGAVELPDGATIRCDTVGEGPDVVFLHPGLWDRRVWDRQMETFPAAGFRATRYDLRGSGGSSRSASEPYSHVGDLIAVMDALGIERAAIVGCSMGGRVAIDTVLTHPDRAWALAAVAAGLGGFEPLQEEEDWWDDAFAGFEEAVEAGELEKARDIELHVWAPLGTDDPAGLAIRRIAFDNMHELTMDTSAEMEIDPPAAHRLSEIDTPTIVLKPEHDPSYMRRTSDLISTGIPDARLVLIEDADHVVNLRQPERFDDVVLGFLAEIRPVA